MSLYGGNGDSLGIDSLSTGISSNGMIEYLENLRASLMTETVEKLGNIETIESAINAGWQGIAKDRFLEKFQEQRNIIAQDLEKEYANLVNRLNELEVQYFQADSNMIDE